MVTKYKVLKLLYEKSPLYLQDVEPGMLRDFKALAKELGAEGYVRTPISLNGSYSLTERGRAYYLDLEEVLYKEISDKAEEKRKIMSERCFDILLFVLGLLAERLTGIVDRLINLITIMIGV